MNILVAMSIHIMYLLISMFNIVFGLIGWVAICLICMHTYRTKIVYTDKVEYSNKVFDAPINLFITNGSFKNINPANIINTVDNCFIILNVDASIPALTVVFNLSDIE